MRGRRVLSLVVFGATRPVPAVGVGGHPGCPLGHPGQGLRPWTLKGTWWLANIRWSCHGCDRYALVGTSCTLLKGDG